MPVTTIPIKSFLGKYYQELLHSTAQDKYKNTFLDTFFDQRFIIQNNSAQMIVDAAMRGLNVIVTGSEIRVSKELFDHSNVNIINSLEQGQSINPKSLYNPAIFSTIAYLICQNHTTIQIVGNIDEPIYVKYVSDYECFYNSIVIFNVSEGIEIEIVEEIESHCALNAVMNYIAGANSNINLSSFYKNHKSALSYVYRNIILQDSAAYNHVVLGKGSSNVVDENRIQPFNNSKSNLYGVIDSEGAHFHSIVCVDPSALEYRINIDYRNILYKNHNVTFLPTLVGEKSISCEADVSVTSIIIEEVPNEEIKQAVSNFVSPIMDRAILSRMTGVQRFYDNKSKFLHL